MAAKKVVLGVDDSEYAVHAFNWYLSHVHRHGLELILVHCNELLEEAGELPSVALYVDMLAEETKRQTKMMKDKFEQLMKDNDIHGKIMALFGPKPGELIVDIAEKEHAMFIVVGSRGLNKHRRTVLGSVSDFVVHHAHCPVIVCKQ